MKKKRKKMKKENSILLEWEMFKHEVIKQNPNFNIGYDFKYAKSRLCSFYGVEFTVGQTFKKFRELLKEEKWNILIDISKSRIK